MAEAEARVSGLKVRANEAGEEFLSMNRIANRKDYKLTKISIFYA